MKAKSLLLLVIPAALAAMVCGYVQMSREQAADAVADQPIAAASHVEHGPGGETGIALDAKTQQLIGLQTAALTAATLPPEIKGYGRALDSAALVALKNTVVAAQAALQASQGEYERLKKLSAQNNASAQALETADAKMKNDQGVLETAEAQLVAASSRAMLNQPADFFQLLVRQENILVRLDLPAGESPEEAPAAAWLTLPGSKQPVVADFLGRAATTDPQTQGAGFIFVVMNAPATLTPGLAVTGFLQLPGKLLSGVIVPDDAVVRSGERAWIYVQAVETNFVRREIILDQPATGGWFATNNVAPGDKVVIAGAQMLLSEERKSQIQIGD